MEKGKEFCFDKLIFEGEYFNGKRNGKGKDYKNGEIVFEGEYLNDQRWNGKGKEFHNYFGTLTFEGEYLNGKKIGKENTISHLVLDFGQNPGLNESTTFYKIH